MVVFAPKVKLNNGKEIPVLGLGTWMIERSQGKELVKAAIDAGYRHIDTAYLYHSEEAVGDGIRAKIEDGTIKREDIFVTSKLWCSYAHPGMVTKALKLSLKNLGLDYLDLYLMHWPISFKAVENPDVPIKADFHDTASIFAVQEYFPRDDTGNIITTDTDYLDVWKEMEQCVKMGLVKSIGVSNCNARQVERLVKEGTIKPVINQVECHAYFNQNKLVQRCKQMNVLVTAYSPLGSSTPPDIPGAPKMMEHPTILKVSKETGKSPAQVILRYLVQSGIIVVPKTVSHKRLVENISIFDFKLSPDQMGDMDSVNLDYRIFTIPGIQKHKYYPFNGEI